MLLFLLLEDTLGSFVRLLPDCLEEDMGRLVLVCFAFHALVAGTNKTVLLSHGCLEWLVPCLECFFRALCLRCCDCLIEIVMIVH